MIPTIEDILLKLQKGDISLDQAIHWIEIHLNDQRTEQQFIDQDRRRRVFEQVALDTLEKMRLGMFQCEIQDFESNLAANIGEVADWIIVQQDIFGSKVQGEK